MGAAEHADDAHGVPDGPETIVSEPAPAPIERVKGKYRYMATFRYGRLAPLRRVLRREIYSVRHPAVEIYVDVDAISML